MHEKPNAGQGTVAGFLVTVLSLIILLLAQVLLGTAFVPFDLFDWMARILPGGLVTFGIDLIVSIIAALNLENTSGTAKTAEHILAISIVLGLGALGGRLLFIWWRRGERDPRSGLIIGVIIGAVLALISAGVNQSATASRFVSMALIAAVFAGWGGVLRWLYDRLTPLFPHELAGGLNRRQFLIRVGGATAALTFAGVGLGTVVRRTFAPEDESIRTWSADNALPNADAALQPAPGTRAEFTQIQSHYRIDINSLPPVVREDDWKLKIHGQIENPLELTLTELRENYEPLHQFITLSCISNPVAGDLIGTQRWTGVSLKRILEDVKPDAEALYLKITSADGFDESIAIERIMEDERIMLAYAWDGLPLTTAHGFPLRIYIPDRYGMKQPKWIMDIEVTERYDEGFWVRRGWDEVARVNATSVVDTVATNNLIQQDNQTLVPIGGMAYAGSRGISKVKIRVDDGDWQEAQLRQPISDLTWVLWRYDWPFKAGEHTVYVRCVDGRGLEQIETSRGERPSGATGIDSRWFFLSKG